MNRLPANKIAFRTRFLAVAAALTLCLLAAAALSSNELRTAFFPREQAVRGDPIPYLGLTYLPLSHDLSARYALDAGEGALVTAVEGGSPAGAAGLRRGDILVAVDSSPLTRTSSLVDLLLLKRPGERVSFQMLRDGSTSTADVLLGTWAER